MLNAISMVVTNSKINPNRKMKSAKFSYRMLNFLELLIERKERILLVIKNSIATAASSSIIVLS